MQSQLVVCKKIKVEWSLNAPDSKYTISIIWREKKKHTSDNLILFGGIKDTLVSFLNGNKIFNFIYVWML